VVQKSLTKKTFATRLLERGVHQFIISALLGHSTQTTGISYASMTPGYAHATWGAMKAAVDSLEQPLQLKQGLDRGKIVATGQKARKAG
jgi:integrase